MRGEQGECRGWREERKRGRGGRGRGRGRRGREEGEEEEDDRGVMRGVGKEGGGGDCRPATPLGEKVNVEEVVEDDADLRIEENTLGLRRVG